MTDGKNALDPRESYIPPRVVKISDLKQGAGDCTSGSGDNVCHNGNLATGFPGGCCTGNSATHDCVNGNSPVSGCHSGNTVFAG